MFSEFFPDFFPVRFDTTGSLYVFEISPLEVDPDFSDTCARARGGIAYSSCWTSIMKLDKKKCFVNQLSDVHDWIVNEAGEVFYFNV